MAASIDKTLVEALKAAKGGKAMQFAFLPKGLESQLLVAKKLSEKEVNDKKKELGSGPATRGRVVGEGGTLVFEVAQKPTPTLKAQLERRLKENAGMTLPVDVRFKGDATDEANEDDAETAPTPTPTGKTASLVVLQQARLAWEAARKKALAEGQKLTAAIRADFAGKPEQAHAAKAVQKMEALLNLFDGRLADTLDAALNAATPELRQKRHDDAARLIADYRATVEGNALFKQFDDNPFVPVAVGKTLSAALNVLESKLHV